MTNSDLHGLTWENLTWQDIQAIGMALAERHPQESLITLKPERLAELVAELPGFAPGDTGPGDLILSAITTAWITVVEGEEDSSPYEYLA